MSFDYESARKYAFDHLTMLLPPGLAYHDLHHTRDQVLPAVTVLCRDMRISGEQQLLITTAALFHDIGFVQQYANNEATGADIAVSVLPDFGYRKVDTDMIRTLIMATTMPQQPKSVAAQILCDADLVTLGQTVFFETSMQLRRETETFLSAVSLHTWLTQQYDFLGRHRYFTAAARHRFDVQKAANRTELKTVLNCQQNRGQS